MIAIATLLIVVTFTLIVNRVGTIALTSTGLSTEVANFQARSAITGVGFSTSESELIVNHPIRRRITLSLMLVGNAGLVTIIATLAAGLLLILLAARSRTIDRLLSSVIRMALRRFTTLQVHDYVELFDLASNYAVVELGVEADSWVAEHRLADLHLPDEGVLVLGIRRADGTFLGAPRGPTLVHEHDTLVLYGSADVLAELRTRKVGMDGDRAHVDRIPETAERHADEDRFDRE